MTKLLKTPLVAFLALAALFLVSCDDDTDGGNNMTDEELIESLTGITLQSDDLFNIRITEKCGQPVLRLSGTINRDITIAPVEGYDWLFSGSVYVVPNSSGTTETSSTLAINAGTTIYFDATSAQVSFLAIAQGAKINAQGTNGNRILMTSSNELGTCTGADGGDWGGLIVNGRASINVGTEAEGEGGSGTYGGNNDEDNSGTIRYLVLKYPGRIIGVDNELNGFSFNGVGSGTTVEYIQCFKGEDDGIEFFGGTVNVKYAVSIGSKDDSFDWTHGWRGNGQFWLVQQMPGRGDRGIEADNLEDDNSAMPYSDPVLSNITFLGTDGNEGTTTGMRLRRGTKGAIHNAIVTSFTSYGIRVSDTETETHVANGDLAITNSTVFGNADDWRDGITQDNFAGSNGNVSTTLTLDRGIGVLTEGAVDPSSVYGTSFFTPANMIGAVNPNNNWLTGWAIDVDGNDY